MIDEPSYRHDTESFELANTRLKLREGLRFVLHESGSEKTFVLRDPVSGTVHQLGLTQYALVSGLNGTITLGQLTQELANTIPHAAMSGEQVEQTARYLLDHQLACAIDASGQRIECTTRLGNQQTELAKQRKAENANPLFVKIPLADPSGLLDKMTPVFGCLFSRAGLIGTAVLILFAGLQLWQYQSDVASSIRALLDPSSAVWLAIVFIGLKLAHEFAHGIACHRLGGRVNETGVVFILFVPIPYVDVTSSWCFQSRPHRMLVSAAGMLIEMAIASVAAIAWTMSVDPVVKFHLMNIILMGTLTTLLFNANFLMRFDGYFLLSDAIRIPNLAPTSRACVSAYARRVFLGRSLSLSQHDRRQTPVLLAYGIAAMMWRVVVCFGLALIASKMWFGFGIILAAASLLVWFGRPFWKFACGLVADTVDAHRDRRYLLRRTLPAAVVVGMLLCVIPWPWQTSAPAVVRHRDSQVVRCATAGFLDEIETADGQTIAAGDVIAKLTDRRLLMNIEKTRSRLAASTLRMQSELASGNIASHQAERALRDSLRSRLDELHTRQDALVIRAEVSGIVVAPGLSNQLGVHCDEGMEVCRIVDPSRKELLVSISQRDLDSFNQQSDHDVQFLFGTKASMPVRLQPLRPHAKSSTDERLTAIGGGPLTMQEFEDGFFLTEPRIEGNAELSPRQSTQLPAGATGSVRLTQARMSVAGRVWRLLSNWIVASV